MFAASKTASVSGGYQISRSLRFNSADSAYLNRTPASASNQKTWTWSGWVKKTRIIGSGNRMGLFGVGPQTGGAGNFVFGFANDASGSGDSLILDRTGVSGPTSTAVYRDVSAWYHIVLAVNTTLASSRVRIYVNGTEITAWSASLDSVWPQNVDTLCNSTNQHRIGQFYQNSEYFDGYITDVNFIDGSQLTPSSFGETNAQTGVWQPKAYSGSYGTNGFYLNFSDNSNTTAATLGKDYSGNGNNWTPNNFSVTAGAGNDSLVDSPTSYGTDTGVGGTVRGNYATLNPLTILPTGVALSITNGNLDYSGSTGWWGARSSIGMTTGKWYCEVTVTGGTTPQNILVGLTTSQASASGADFYAGIDAYGWGYYGNNGNKFNSNSPTAYGSAYTTNDVVGIAFDADAGTLIFYKNGVSQGTAFTGLTNGPYFFTFSEVGATASVNFGQRAFAYTAPSGFKALCTQNLPTPTIGATTATQAGKYFNTILWSGDGAGTRSLTNVGFQPSFSWTKTRNSSAQYHALFDAVRGGNKTLFSNATLAENVNSASGYISTFDSDGFSVIGGNDTNASGLTYVGWNWAGNGSGSTNTAGSITSTVSANTTSGFSVVTYTGNGTSLSTVGHGLGAVPSMVIVKARSASGLSWYVYQKDVGNTKFLELNTTAAPTTFNLWESTNPTSSVFTISNNAAINGSGTTFVAYCFAPVSGYSAFGSYTGNGSTTDGVFIYTGFRPKYIMFKGSSVVTNWSIFDTSRSPYNLSTQVLGANISDAEFTTADSQIDILSNGIKIRSTTTTSGINQSGATYIFAAFAETPFKYSLAR